MMGAATAMLMNVAPAGTASATTGEAPAGEGTDFIAALANASGANASGANASGVNAGAASAGAAAPATEGVAAPAASSQPGDAPLPEGTDPAAAALLAAMLPAATREPELPAADDASLSLVSATGETPAGEATATDAPVAGDPLALAAMLSQSPIVPGDTAPAADASTDSAPQSVASEAVLPAKAAPHARGYGRAAGMARGVPGLNKQSEVVERTGDADAQAITSAATAAAPRATPAAEAANAAQSAAAVTQLPRNDTRSASATRSAARGADAKPLPESALRNLMQAFKLSQPATAPETRDAAVVETIDGLAANANPFAREGAALPARNLELPPALAAAGAATATPAPAQDASQAAFAAATGQAATASPVTPQGVGNGVEHAVRSTVGTPRWADELGSQLVMMNARGQQEGSLSLTPEHLGPLEVRISVSQNTASIWFGAQHADTRAALTESLPRLRELFADAGLALGHAGVSHEAPRGQGREAAPTRVGGQQDLAAAVQVEAAPAARRIVRGLVDTYA